MTWLDYQSQLAILHLDCGLSSQAAEAHVLKDGYNELTTIGCVRLQRAKPKKERGKKDPITPVPVIIESLQQKL